MRFICIYGILDHCGLCFRYCILSLCQRRPAFSLVSDRLGGQVSEQKDAEALDKVKMLKKIFFGKIADTAFCIVADNLHSPTVYLR